MCNCKCISAQSWAWLKFVRNLAVSCAIYGLPPAYIFGWQPPDSWHPPHSWHPRAKNLEAAKNAICMACLHIFGSLQIFDLPRIWRKVVGAIAWRRSRTMCIVCSIDTSLLLFVFWELKASNIYFLFSAFIFCLLFSFHCGGLNTGTNTHCAATLQPVNRSIYKYKKKMKNEWRRG